MVFIKNSNGNPGKIKKFSKGEKFTMGGKIYIVSEEIMSDNTELRRIRSDEGEDTIIMLTTLIQDTNLSRDFNMLELEKKVVKAKEEKKIKKIASKNKKGKAK